MTRRRIWSMLEGVELRYWTSWNDLWWWDCATAELERRKT